MLLNVKQLKKLIREEFTRLHEVEDFTSGADVPATTHPGKVIFLDIDGVIATNESYNRARKIWGWNQAAPSRTHLLALLDRDRVALLNEITTATGADIILSSTWRNPENIGGHDAISILQEAGVAGNIIGKTPRASTRGAEIAAEIVNRGLGPEDYVILDDDSTSGDGLKALGHKGSRWIRTPEKTGLSPRHRDRAIELLS
jgi:hypothetical protein